VSESLATLDSFSRLKTYSRILAESLGFSDTASEIKSYTRTILELLGMETEGSVPVPINPYAWWHLNASSGTVVSDSSGHGKDLTTLNMIDSDWIPAKLNNGLIMNQGTDKDEEIYGTSSICNFERTDPWTMECWFKPSETPVGNTEFFNKMNETTWTGFWIAYYSSHKITVALKHSNSPSNRIEIEYPFTFTAGNWYHLVCSYNGSSLASGVKVYINNIQLTPAIIYNNLTLSILNSQIFRVGHDPTPPVLDESYLKGTIDEVVVYDRVLSAEEVAYRYNSGVGTELMEIPVVNFLQRRKAIRRIVSEISGLVDVRSRMKTIKRSLSEKLGMLDTKSRTLTRIRAVSEILGLNDSPLTLQAYYIINDDSYDTANLTRWLAQTFTVGATGHSITSVKLKMFRIISPGTVTVSIRATSSGHPTGSDLTVGTINGNLLTTNSNGLWYEIALTEYKLSANVKYAIIVRGSAGGSNAVCWRCDAFGSIYPGGNREWSINSGDTWTSGTDSDFMFEVWGYKISRIKSYYRIISSEILGFLDSISKRKTYRRFVTEILGMVDTRSRQKALKRAIVEVLGTIDTHSRGNKTLHRVITEYIGLFERVSAILGQEVVHYDKPKQEIENWEN
jgi:hypothetical protein